MRTLFALWCAAVAIPAFAEDAYTIQIRLDPDVGKTVTYKMTRTDRGSMRAFDADGKLLFEEKTDGEEETRRSTILARDKDGKATRTVRTYEKAIEREEGKAKVLSRQGRTFLLEQVAGKPRVSVVGEPTVDPKEVEELYKGFGKKSTTRALLSNLSPGRPVKVGDSWAIPVRPFIETLDDMPADLEKSSVRAKLVKVHTRGKTRFGTFEVAMKFVLLGKAERDGLVMTFEKPGEFSGTTTLVVAIDGSTIERTETGQVVMKGEAAVVVAGLKLRAVIDRQGTGSDEVSAEVDDPKAREVGKVVYLPAPGEWAEFKPEDGLFTADFPGRPTPTAKKGAGYTQRTWTLEAKGRTAVYAVEVVEHAHPDTVDPAAVLKAVVTDTKNLRGQAEAEVTGVKGVEVRFAADVNGTTYEYRQRAAVTKQRSVHLIVAVQAGKAADADRFFKSFRMNWAAPARPVQVPWVTFKPKTGSFSVSLPATPIEQTKKRPDGGSETTWLSESDDGQVGYVVSVADIGIADPSKVNPKEVLTAAANGHTGVKDLKHVTVDGHPGVEFHRSDTLGEQPLEYRLRMVLVNGQLFQQVVAAPKGKGPAADIDKFFRSFKVLVKPVKDD